MVWRWWGSQVVFWSPKAPQCPATRSAAELLNTQCNGIATKCRRHSAACISPSSSPSSIRRARHLHHVTIDHVKAIPARLFCRSSANNMFRAAASRPGRPRCSLSRPATPCLPTRGRPLAAVAADAPTLARRCAIAQCPTALRLRARRPARPWLGRAALATASTAMGRGPARTAGRRRDRRAATGGAARPVMPGAHRPAARRGRLEAPR